MADRLRPLRHPDDAKGAGAALPGEGKQSVYAQAAGQSENAVPQMREQGHGPGAFEPSFSAEAFHVGC